MLRDPFLSFVVRAAGLGAFALLLGVLILGLLPPQVGNKLTRNMRVPMVDLGYTRTRLAEADSSTAVDVLFLGSSLCYRGFDTRIWQAHGLSAFNIGSHAQTPLQSEMLLTRYLHRFDPKLVVLTADPAIVANQGIEASLDMLAHGDVDHAAFIMTLRTGQLKTWITFLHCFLRTRALGGKGRAVEHPYGMDTYIPGGFVVRDTQDPQHEELVAAAVGSRHEHEHATHADPATRRKQIAAIERMAEQLRRNKVPFVILEPPVTASYRATYEDHAEFQRRMAEIAVFMDFSRLATLDDTLHFYDEAHLEQRGVELFNAAVIDRLRAEGQLLR